MDLCSFFASKEVCSKFQNQAKCDSCFWNKSIKKLLFPTLFYCSRRLLYLLDQFKIVWSAILPSLFYIPFVLESRAKSSYIKLSVILDYNTKYFNGWQFLTRLDHNMYVILGIIGQIKRMCISSIPTLLLLQVTWIFGFFRMFAQQLVFYWHYACKVPVCYPQR